MKRIAIGLLAVGFLLAGTVTAGASEIVKTYSFAVDNWNQIGEEDGPVTLHRIRLDKKHDRLTQATLARRANEEFLQPIRYHLEYSNSSSAKRRVRVTLRWLDGEGRVIDGFGATETLMKKSSQRVVQSSVATLKYGLDRAETLEVKLRFEP